MEKSLQCHMESQCFDIYIFLHCGKKNHLKKDVESIGKLRKQTIMDG